jgi:phage terminase large subunit
MESLKAFDSGYRIIVNQGGTRSGKTFSITELMIALACRAKYSISICSVAFPHLRKGAMRDWRKIMEDFGLYDPKQHMKTEQLYTYPTGSYIEFFSVDNQLKVRGPGRDILFINEANIINYETFRQLLLRTKRAIFIDYNPADEFHWIYDKVLTRPDCYFIKSTYNDNPFIPKEQRSEIESYKDADPNFWRIYGEGERGHSEGIIFTHWQPFSAEIPGEIGYGLDFGYNNPTALCRVVQFAGGIQVTEEFYQSKVTNNDLIEVLKQLVSPYDPIYCDAAEPQRIEEIKRAGFKALPANKDVKAGIDFIKSRKLFIHQGSVNLLKEIKSYKFKVNKNKVGNTPEEPLKLNDHACDAMRYAAISFKQPKVTFHTTFHKT